MIVSVAVVIGLLSIPLTMGLIDIDLNFDFGLFKAYEG